MQALRLLRIMDNMINLAEYLNIRNNYKDLCRNIKREYENKQRQISLLILEKKIHQLS